MKKLGKLEAVSLRSHWPDEARSFTPWLASEEGLALLNEALGMDLETVDTEIQVGSYRADIVANDSGSGEKVVIENQLEATDHDHIGKLITYAAGVGAKTAVWVARHIREEHRRAIDWLNDNSSSDLSFFAVEVELWKIGDSLAAPRLSVVAQPSADVRVLRGTGTEGEGGKTYVEFWTAFVEHLERSGSDIRKRKPQPQHWYDVSIGRSGVHIALTVRLRNKDLGCELYINIPEAKQLFRHLEADKTAIEAEIGTELQWKELPDKKASRIVARAAIDATDSKNWPKAFEWFTKEVASFKKVMVPRVRSFMPGADEDEEGEG